jgi:hypothetical protein
MSAAGLAPPDQPLFKFDKKTPQRLVGAASLLIAAGILFSILWPLRWSLLSTWVVIEVIFYVLYWRPRYAELNEQPDKHEPKNLDAMKTFQRFLRFCKDLPKGIDYQAYYSGWFRGAAFSDIKRGEQHLASTARLHPIVLDHRAVHGFSVASGHLPLLEHSCRPHFAGIRKRFRTRQAELLQEQQQTAYPWCVIMACDHAKTCIKHVDANTCATGVGALASCSTSPCCCCSVAGNAEDFMAYGFFYKSRCAAPLHPASITCNHDCLGRESFAWPGMSAHKGQHRQPGRHMQEVQDQLAVSTLVITIRFT